MKDNFAKELHKVAEQKRSYALKLAQNSFAADDLIQEALCTAWKKQKLFQKGTNLNAWFAIILKRAFLNSKRDKKRKTDDSTLYVDNIYDYQLLTSSSSNKAIETLSIEQINKCIDSLKEKCKAPLLLRIEGYKYDEIAIILGVAQGTVKSKIHSARKELQDKLTKLGYGK